MTESAMNPFVFASYPRMDKKTVEDIVYAAQTTYGQLPSEAHFPLARMLFLRLVDLNEIEPKKIELRPRRVFMTELILSDGDQSNRIREVVGKFEKSNILIVDKLNDQPFVSLNHEILLKEWDLLHTWVRTEGLDTIRLQRRVNAAAADWKAQGCAKESLYRGKLLKEASTLAEGVLLNDDETTFIKASMMEQGTQFNWEVAKMAAIGVGIVGTALAAFTKMQVDSQLAKTNTKLETTRYWRNRHSRDVRRLKKSLQKGTQAGPK